MNSPSLCGLLKSGQFYNEPLTFLDNFDASCQDAKDVLGKDDTSSSWISYSGLSCGKNTLPVSTSVLSTHPAL